MSVVHYACKFGETSLVKLLLGTYKADPDLRNNAGKTALHIAVEFDKIECAKLLKIIYKACSEISDYSGLLPIHYASPDAFHIYLGFLGSRKGFNKNNPIKKKVHSFDELSPIKLVRRAQSKDDTNDSFSPRMRYKFLSISKENRGAVYCGQFLEESEES